VVEDNYAGGIGGAVATAAAQRGGIRVSTLTCQTMPKSGKSADDVLKYVGIDQAAICSRAKALLGKA
jgi:transketolase